jgi:hypothetical protein
MTSGIGRVEAALEREFPKRAEIGPAERAALRSQARAIDVAERRGDVDAVSRGNAVYFQLRAAAGLSAAGEKQPDAWDRVLADAMRPASGGVDPADA